MIIQPFNEKALSLRQKSEIFDTSLIRGRLEKCAMFTLICRL